MKCSHSNNCPMFKMLAHAGALRSWQIRYCDGDYAKCERYKRSALGRAVPDDLLPNGALLRLRV